MYGAKRMPRHMRNLYYKEKAEKRLINPKNKTKCGRVYPAYIYNEERINVKGRDGEERKKTM